MCNKKETLDESLKKIELLQKLNCLSLESVKAGFGAALVAQVQIDNKEAEAEAESEKG